MLATTIALALGLFLKLPCLDAMHQERSGPLLLCYSDIPVLYQARELTGPSLLPGVEYPVAQALLMGLTARIANGALAYFFVNVGVLAVAALTTAALLQRMVGARALFFSLSPALILYGFLNWDLLPVAISTAAVYVFLSRHDVGSGGLLGLGAATKLYPALSVLPFAVHRFAKGKIREATWLMGASIGVWAALNVPFAFLSRPEWTLVYRFSAVRPVDWGSLWYLACHDESWRFACSNISLLNASSLVLFAGLSLVVWRLAMQRASFLPLWASSFPLLIVFLLSSKVYSPQYSLWLVPWFALAQPRIGLFAAFSLADLFVFVAEAFWIQTRLEPETFPVAVLELAVVARAAVLVFCLVSYFRGDGQRLPLDRVRQVAIPAG